jgi:hypothetical protein
LDERTGLFEDDRDLLQRKPVAKKLFVVANFCLNRKLEKIFEYAVIYRISWGELYCRVFANQAGFNSVRQIVDHLGELIDIPIDRAELGAFVSPLSRNRIKIGDGFFT